MLVFYGGLIALAIFMLCFSSYMFDRYKKFPFIFLFIVFLPILFLSISLFMSRRKDLKFDLDKSLSYHRCVIQKSDGILDKVKDIKDKMERKHRLRKLFESIDLECYK